MNLSQVDLNLFVIFDAIYTEGNLTRAGQITGKTQPAISNALSRLRDVFDDPLFTRTASGMVPTPTAKNMIEPVRQALQLLRASVQSSDTFNPKDTEKSFIISMTDYSESLILPRLLSFLRRNSSNIKIESFHTPRRERLNAMAAGTLDFAIDAPLSHTPQMKHHSIFQDHYVCLVRKDHPLVRGETISLDQYLSLSHIHLSTRQQGLGHVDLGLSALGVKRNIVLRAHNTLMTLPIISETDLALTTTHCLARRLRQYYDLQILQLPYEVPQLELHLYWHESMDQDPAHIWLRNLIADQTRTLQAACAAEICALPGFEDQGELMQPEDGNVNA